MTKKSDISTEDDIKKLVDRFYEKVILDPMIGYIFTEIAQLSWEKHIPIMYKFWSSTLLGTKSYSGNPMVVHIELSKKTPLQKEHFDRWLELWHQTIEENFEGKTAQEAITRAGHIARMMLLKISDHAH